MSNISTAAAETNTARACRGYGEECGNPIESGDLCPDCTMGRMNAESPRIPR